MVNKSNFRFKEQLQVCCEEKVDKNKRVKKWFKALIFIKGMKKLNLVRPIKIFSVQDLLLSIQKKFYRFPKFYKGLRKIITNACK
jgi:hypothetical protein